MHSPTPESADGYVFLPGYTAGTPRDCYPKAMAAAKKALELDETLAEAHTTLALALWYDDFDFAQANTGISTRASS